MRGELTLSSQPMLSHYLWPRKGNIIESQSTVIIFYAPKTSECVRAPKNLGMPIYIATDPTNRRWER
jgi:hypothetical protein